jgi:uncharacterized UPF0160 family protein
VYNEAIQRFDHHQRGFEEVFGHGFVTKLSSAGLVYKSVALEVQIPVALSIGGQALRSGARSRPTPSPGHRREGPNFVAQDVQGAVSSLSLHRPSVNHTLHCQEFVEAIDGVDNGVEQYIDDAGKPAKSRYRSGTSLSSRVGHLNPAWNEPSSPDVYDVRVAIFPSEES